MYSKRINNLSESFTRRILALTKKSDIISFAGGLPSSKFLEANEFKRLYAKVVDKYGTTPFQYAPTAGLVPLREKIATYTNLKDFDEKNILITSGSSEALDIVCRAFLDDGDKVLVQDPTYLAALNLFRLYGAKLITQSDNEKMSYVITKFQNPTNVSWSEDDYLECKKDYEDKDCVVVEDNPYMLLDSKEQYDSITNYLPQNGIYLGSFSKVAAPDFRLGYIAASEEFITKFTQIKGVVNLQASYINQYILDEWIKEGGFKTHIQKVSVDYKHKSKYFQMRLKEIFGNRADCESDFGGMFAWVEFINTDTSDLFEKCIKKGVAFVPGRYFYADNRPHSSFARFNFTSASEEDISKGLKIIYQTLTNSG